MPRSLRDTQPGPMIESVLQGHVHYQIGHYAGHVGPGPQLDSRSGRVGSWLYGIGLGTRVRDCGTRDQLFENSSHVSAGFEILQRGIPGPKIQEGPI